MTQTNIDLARSLRECDPQKYYSQFEGVTFEKRVRIKRNLVTWRFIDQPREEDSDDKRVGLLYKSYTEHGIVYSKPPQAIIRDPDNKERFIGKSGFGRNDAQDLFDDWEYMIYDILTFKDNLAEEAFKYTSNDTVDHLPAEPNSETSLVKAVVNAINKGIIFKEDDAILNYLMRIAKSKGVKRHNVILEKIRDEEISYHATMKSWSSKKAEKFAKANGLPYKGDKNANATSLGYCSKTSSYKTIFWDSMKKSVEYAGKPVFFTTWVSGATPSLLQQQRTGILKKYDGMIDTLENFVSQWLDIPKDKIKEKRNRFPIKFNGFLPQDTEERPEKNGEPKEDTLVDTKGKAWKRLDK